MLKKFIAGFILLYICHSASAQFLMDMVDTTTETGKGMLGIYKKFDHLRLSGYIQPQFQVAQEKGIRSYEGGNFDSQVSNRFMFRRSRVRIDYVHFGEGAKPGVQIVFQFDANERAFTVRDVWGRITENKFQLFSFTTGMFARPFGYEVNLSSSDRESPERGRMSQAMMKSERDLGAMISFDVRKKDHKLAKLKIDAGLFNGQGINSDGDFDNYKDFIGRISLKPVNASKRFIFSGGLSTLQGGLLNNTKYHYQIAENAGSKVFVVDSTEANEGTKSPRKYYGADMQFKFANAKGFTELRLEGILGKQTGTFSSNETPVELREGMDGFYERNFRGAYVYFLQHLFSLKHQLVLKYDFYDPNSDVKGSEISSGFSGADIRYDTYGAGYIYHISENVKLMLYYAHVKNEKTNLSGYTKDIRDDVLTCRMQFRF